MSEKIAVLVDSGCDVSQTVVAASPNLAIVALNVRQNGVDYLDGVDLTPDEFYAHLTPDNLPQTASPAPAMVAAHMQDLFDAGYTKILALSISGALSATYQGMRLAAQEFKAGQVMVLDTKSAGIGSGLLVAYALQLIADGREFADVIAAVQHSVQHSGVWLYIPSLTYLQAGGRIGKVAGTLGSVLNIKPLLSVDDNGEIIAVGKVRSEKKAVQKLIDIALATAGPHATIAVAHGANFELLHEVTAQIEATGHHVEFTGSVSPAIGVHTGPGLIGIAVQNP